MFNLAQAIKFHRSRTLVFCFFIFIWRRATRGSALNQNFIAREEFLGGTTFGFGPGPRLWALIPDWLTYHSTGGSWPPVNVSEIWPWQMTN